MRSAQNLSAPKVEEFCKILLSQNKIEELLVTISRFIRSIALDERYVGKIIYCEAFDLLINQIASKFSKNYIPNLDKGNIPVIVCTELYTYGGHSRIVEDLQYLYSNAIVLCTSFNPFSTKTSFTISNGVEGINSVVLPNDSAVNNTARLIKILNGIASEVFLVTHHHDTVANVAASSFLGPIYYIHHSDHRVSLGSSNTKFVHIDLVKNVYDNCCTHLNGCVQFWPQMVMDVGCKEFDYPLKEIITCTSGSSNKFSWNGNLALPLIIANLLKDSSTIHYHVGHLSNDQLALIYSELNKSSIKNDRFVYITSVRSLWGFFKDFPVNVFIGSAPMHGLRTAIEAQGAGLPILPYLQEKGSSLDDAYMYPESVMSWSTIDSLLANLRVVIDRHQFYSETSRNFYIANFSISNFTNAIKKTKAEVLKII